MLTELLTQDEMCDMADAMTSLIADKKDFCSQDAETEGQVARLESLLAKVQKQQAEFDLVHRQPHEVTFAVFSQRAKVVALTNHGRRWQVTFGNYSAFSDAETSVDVLRDVHGSAVNNALYLNQPDAPDIGFKPSMPPVDVLNEYPEVVALFPKSVLPLTAEQHVIIDSLRLQGYAVVLFSPDDLEGVNVENFQNRLRTDGWDHIEDMKQLAGN
ncbi:hypothetical protein [Pseudomonas sp. NPDC096950]|uniref:hypothetical protein n=1 Tax=Pseudomonas sp. NPDC096950 TaxID=3364485 RepID=UPI00383AFFE0